MLSLNDIQQRFAERQHQAVAFDPSPMQAAVAMILAEGESELDVCFIRRAERQGDPWSGQVAFPGGRASGTDNSANAVAERETFEEIGLDLVGQRLIAPLPVREIQRQHLDVLSPFIYFVDSPTRETAFVREAHEVASVFWVPISHLFDSTTATELDYPLGGSTQTFSGIRFGEHVIWGLTLRILESFADIMQCELAARN